MPDLIFSEKKIYYRTSGTWDIGLKYIFLFFSNFCLGHYISPKWLHLTLHLTYLARFQEVSHYMKKKVLKSGSRQKSFLKVSQGKKIQIKVGRITSVKKSEECYYSQELLILKSLEILS
ncbi:fanconi-associated nuclease 1 [Platysternon megacephalum]|uniref:Fanconi-associated nuclease 1 n=1 Tax=Platysternon megacephalum TaxID=55544 RepID=A0A4D9EIU6_9SAUR|nr:fanconi-associated nuclease 1 [Platysternon megacephalum]